MDQVITLALHAIKEILESSSEQTSDDKSSDLIDIHDFLKQLLESTSPRNNLTQFCRQLNRLMNYNDIRSKHFWSALHKHISYIVEQPNDEQSQDENSELFITRMNFERILEERELHFQKTLRKQKSWHELLCEHEEFFKEYLQKCISLHSKVQVKGLFEDVNDLLSTVSGLTEFSVDSDSQKRLKETMKHIEINLDCSNRSLKRFNSQFSMYDNSYKRVNNSFDNFLPSVEKIKMNGNTERKEIGDALRCDRWLVILGDPGSAKTTLLRWITRIFAEAANRSDEKVMMDGNEIPVRIPILIQIGKLAEWLGHYQIKSLIDYIGEHTWVEERYCNDKNKSALKELIYHGHALILLDGLDEIPDVKQRGQIIDLVKKFVAEYVYAPDFISAFDHRVFDVGKQDHLNEVVETQPPGKPGGNQIVITSRIVGYQLHPLVGSFIQHYSLSLMNYEEAKKFATKWISEIETSVLKLLSTEGIQFNADVVQILSKKRYNAVESTFKNLSDEFYPKSRGEVYYYAVQMALRSWTAQEPSISENLLNDFLIELATFLHLNSQSGLIDEFDIKKLCYLTLKQKSGLNDRTKLREYADKMVSLLESNIGIASERGLQAYGFLHLSFQEYFVAQSFVKGSSIEAIVKRILSFTINPRFRESLLLALDWISWKWSFDDYNQFCNILITSNSEYAIPLGTLLYFDAFDNMQRLPSKTVIYKALNNLLDHPSNSIKKTYLPLNLLKLSEDIIIDWMQSYLIDETRLSKFCQSLLESLDRPFLINPMKWKPISSAVYRQLWSFHNRSISTEFIIDQTLRRKLMLDDISEQIFNKSLSLYLMPQAIFTFNTHPLILSVIIAVCGGAYLTKEEGIIKIEFSPKKMHRESSIIESIVNYFFNNEESHSIKIDRLIKHYENVIQKSSPSDASLNIVDTFIGLICLKGVSQPLIYEKYAEYQALSLALDRLKQTWFYFKKLCHQKSSTYSPLETSFIKSQVETILNVCISQRDQSDQERISLSVACAAAWKKLAICYNLNVSVHQDNDGTDLDFKNQSQLVDPISEEGSDQTEQYIRLRQRLQEKPSVLLTSLPESLQKLYYCMLIDSTNDAGSLSIGMVLSECLTYLSDMSTIGSKFYRILSILELIFKKHMLENYVLVLFREEYPNNARLLNRREQRLKEMNDSKLSDLILIDQPILWNSLINEELQHIRELKSVSSSEENDWRLFAASISPC